MSDLIVQAELGVSKGKISDLEIVLATTDTALAENRAALKLRNKEYEEMKTILDSQLAVAKGWVWRCRPDL